MLSDQESRVSEEPMVAINRGLPYADEEIRAILGVLPTRQNCELYGRLFGRTPGAIELVYRWAHTPTTTIRRGLERQGKGHNPFIAQVKRIAKEMGFVA